jgi:hypothetical protein
LVISYLLGSLPVVFLLGRLKGVDLRRVGTRNVGGGNLWQTAGPIYGAIGGLADIAKGALPPAIALRFGLGGWMAALGGLAGVAGQCWPLFLGFRGGRGVSASLGMHMILAPKEFFMAAVPMVAALLARNLPLILRRGLPFSSRLKAAGPKTRFVPMAVLGGIGSMPFLTLWRRRPPSVVFAAAADLAILVVRRLTADLHEDLERGLPIGRTLVSRLLFDRPYEG